LGIKGSSNALYRSINDCSLSGLRAPMGFDRSLKLAELLRSRVLDV
jgi:hypothetical protein